jgi:hypothetical protein
MTWFKVDDGLHSHPKAMAASLAAVGLWTVAGSWAGKHLTDGLIPDHAISSLARGQVELAKELVAAGLWTRVKGGYRFHDWTDRNPSKEKVESDRAKKAAAGRAGGLASGRARSKGSKPGSTNEARASPLVEPPTRPSSSTKKRGSDGAPATQATRAADPECPQHVGLPAHNCRACRSEQLGAS